MLGFYFTFEDTIVISAINVGIVNINMVFPANKQDQKCDRVFFWEIAVKIPTRKCIWES